MENKKPIDNLLNINNILNEKKELKDENNHIRVAIVGNVDSGKSTLVGVLSKGIPDDGRGSARKRVFNYIHEEKTGRTSSIANEIMGFDKEGNQVLGERFNQNKNKYWGEIVSKSNKIVNLVDLCGHEKYLKTTMFGMVGMIPDYVMIIIGANMGISRMTKEHLGITLALNIPFFVVITKVDMINEEYTKKTYQDLLKLLKAPSVNRKPLLITDEKEINIASDSILSDKICPIFKVSSLTKENINLLTIFMRNLKSRIKSLNTIKSINDPIEFDIHEKFTVNGIGLCLSGILKSGTIKIGSQVLCGPDKFNSFKSYIIKSIHINRTYKEEAYSGQSCTISIKCLNKKDELNKKSFRKGMVIIDSKVEPKSYRRFKAEIVILHHSTTIKEGYEAVMHTGVVRQSVCIKKLEKDLLRTGDKSLVDFRFLYSPEYIKTGMTILLREGRTKILGIITEVYND